MSQKNKDAEEILSRKPTALPTDEKIARLLGLLVVKDITEKSDQALTLLSAGFDAAEISEILGVNKNYAHMAAYRKKQKSSNKS